MSDKIQKFIHINRVQEILDCGKDVVYNLIRDGRLATIRLGKRSMRISKDSLMQYIETQKINPDDFFK